MAAAMALALLLAWPDGVFAADKKVGNDKGSAVLAGDVIRWLLQWREGLTLRYAAEDYDDERDGDSRERTRVTGIETVSIREARDDGYLQAWSFADTRFEVLEGDPAAADVMQGFMESLADLELQVELDGRRQLRRYPQPGRYFRAHAPGDGAGDFRVSGVRARRHGRGPGGHHRPGGAAGRARRRGRGDGGHAGPARLTGRAGAAAVGGRRALQRFRRRGTRGRR